MNSGIYIIYNKINGKFYLGGTVGFKKRMGEHFRLLERKDKQHHSAHLQNAYNKYGKSSFIFCIIEKCPKNKVREVEQYYLDYLCPWDVEIGYNVSKNALHPMTGRKHTQSSIDKNRASQVGDLGNKAKLTWEKVDEIRQLYNTGEFSQIKLAEIFGVYRSCIEKITNNHRWVDENWEPIKKNNSGENNGRAKLSESQVKEIIELYKTGDYTQVALENIYKISRSVIGNILRNKLWKEIERN